MDPQSGARWAEVERLLDQALELAPSDRLQWLEHVCSDNPDLRREVERLLRGAEEAGSFLGKSAGEFAAPLMARVVGSQALSPGDRLGTYEIERELGRGGMATIYLARDLRHHRPVAVKVLRPELTAALGADRFLREIEIAARMQHPHILPLFDSGRSSLSEQPGPDRLWYVMPYVDGESLRARLAREHQLPVEDALQITRQVAAALSYAHGRGIIHRDIKPENILLEGGEAVVADFGIARAISGALDQEAAQQLTETGLALGTPAYMSPEQALGEDDLDPRTDIYALGCVLYEMLAGEPPYTGPSAQAVVAKRLSEPVPHVRTLRDAVPQSVEDAITRALARSRADRFDTADEFVGALAGGAATGPGRSWSRRAAVAVLGTALLLGGSWAVLRHHPGTPVDLSNTLAVLPFRVVDPSLGLWREGMVDLLSINLDGAAGLRTIHPRTVLSRWHREVGDETRTDQSATLGVAQRSGARYALTGSIVGSGKDIRLTAELYEVGGGSVKARVQVEGPSDSIPGLVDRLSLDLLRSGAVGAVAGNDAPDISGATTRSLEALKSYLAGEQKFRRARAPEAIEDFKHAVEADSTFALALYRLSLAEGWSVSPHELGEGDQGYAARAARYSDRLRPREALLVRALTQLNPGFLESIQTLRTATRQYPEDAEAWFLLGDALFHIGGMALEPREEFRRALRRSIELDPAFGPAYLHLAEDAFDRLDSAAVAQILASLRRIDPASPKTTGIWLAQALTWGDSTARREARAALDTAPTYALLTAKHATNATPDLWRTTLVTAGALAGQSRHPATDRASGDRGIGYVYATRGQLDRAREAWKRASILLGMSPPQMELDLAYWEEELILAGSPDSAAGRRASEVLKSIPDSIVIDRDWVGLFAAHLGDWSQVDRWSRRAAVLRRRAESGHDTLRIRMLRAEARLFRALAAQRRGDSAEALNEMRAAIQDYPNSRNTDRFMRLEVGRRLLAIGDLHGAARYLGSLGGFWMLLPALTEYDLGRIYERLGDREQAIHHYGRMVRWWKDADPELKPLWEEGRRALARVTAER
jgi:serine/threonine protein kinase/tetratricopeptide (TPR) repeat protein